MARSQVAPAVEAPFLTGPSAVDPALAQRVLDRALSRGGDFADLYFEYRRSASLAMEDGRVRTVGGGVDMGVGVRVVDGESVGYAYAEDLEPEDMLHAAETAARIAASSASVGPVRVRRRRAPARYPVAAPVVDLPGQARVELLRRADRAARRASRRIVRVDASLVAVTKEILVVSSAGVWMTTWASTSPQTCLGHCSAVPSPRWQKWLSCPCRMCWNWARETA